MTSQSVVWQICLDVLFIASENKMSPEARSTESTGRSKFGHSAETMVLRYSPGTTKLFNGASSGMGVFGSTNAPVLISGTLGVLGEEGLVASTTLAKCVGTATLGGEPMTSCVC